MIRSTTERQSLDVSSTFALSTEVSLRRRAARELGRGTHHALDLRDAVAADVERLGGGALLVSEIDAAGELANHHDVDALQELGFDRRGAEHRRMGHDGAKIGEQPEGLAQLQKPLFRTHRRAGVGPLGAAHRAQENGVGAPAQLERHGRQRLAARVDGRAADQRRFESKRVAMPLRDARQRAHRLGGHFRADAVAAQYRDQGLHVEFFLGARQPPDGRRAS